MELSLDLALRPGSAALGSSAISQPGPISFVGSAPVVAANDGGAISIAFANLRDAAGATPTVAAGDFVIVAYGTSVGVDQDISMATAGYTEVADLYANAGAADANLGVFRKFLTVPLDTAAAPTTVTGSSVSNIATAFVFRGVNSVSPLDTTVATATGTGSSLPDPGAVTPVTPGAWIVVIGEGSHPGTVGGVAYTLPADLSATTNHWRSGAADGETNNVILGVGLKTDWASGAFDPAVWTGGTTGVNDGWAAVTLVLKPGPF
jgi:hypothetical protein